MPATAAIPPVVCQVIERHDNGMAKVSLRLQTSKNTAGRFQLKIMKSDIAGNANLQQKGTFSLLAGQSQEFGQMMLSVSPDGQLTILGSVQIADEIISCRNHEDQKI